MQGRNSGYIITLKEFCTHCHGRLAKKKDKKWFWCCQSQLRFQREAGSWSGRHSLFCPAQDGAVSDRTQVGQRGEVLSRPQTPRELHAETDAQLPWVTACPVVITRFRGRGKQRFSHCAGPGSCSLHSGSS